MQQQPRPKILVFPFNLLSHYMRCVELVKQYRGQYDVLFKHSSKYGKLLASEHLPVFACADFDADYVMACTRKFKFSWLNEQDIDKVLVAQVQCIKEYVPELVIGDMSPTLKMAAEMTNTPFLSVINGYMSRHYELQRPITSIHPAAFLKRWIPEKIFAPILEKQERKAFELIHKPFRKIRRRYQLKETTQYLDELEGDNTLICDHAAVFPQRELPESYRVIGPLLYSPASDEGSTNMLNSTKKKLLVTFGSSGDWEKVAGLNDPLFSGFEVLTAGDEKGVLGAEHVTPLNFVNLDQLLPHIDLLICHGGNGTLNYAYKYKVPFIAIPSIMEQEWNALRFSEVASGTVLTGRVSIQKLLAAIEAMLPS